MLDTSAIGAIVGPTLLDLEGEFPEGRVLSVALVIEVDDGSRPTEWRVFSDADRAWLSRAILEEGLAALDMEGERSPDDTSDDMSGD